GLIDGERDLRSPSRGQCGGQCERETQGVRRTKIHKVRLVGSDRELRTTTPLMFQARWRCRRASGAARQRRRCTAAASSTFGPWLAKKDIRHRRPWRPLTGRKSASLHEANKIRKMPPVGGTGVFD